MAASQNREAIIQTSARISSLRDTLGRTKEDLKQAEALLDRLLSGEPVEQPGVYVSRLRSAIPTEDDDRSLNQKILDLIDAEPARCFTAEDIFAVLPEAKTDSVRSALARLADDKINRPERGRYQSKKVEVLS